MHERIMAIYPPGKLMQRGEDRCQAKMDDSASQAMRAANDLGYAASMLEGRGFRVFLRDYQTEGCRFEDLEADFRAFEPHAIFVSVTTASLPDDVEQMRRLKQIDPNLVVIAKGALFFDPAPGFLDELDLEGIDYLIGGESDFIIDRLVECHFRSPQRVVEIPGICFRRDGGWRPTDFRTWERDLDKLRFPDRGKMNNGLYLRPDTGEPMATVTTSRGCPESCIYCLTPVISGKKLRVRSPQNIFEELRDCYHNHGIRNFFFKSDTFTMNKAWVKGLCDEIVQSDLAGKIAWVANSRVNPLEQDTLHYMKAAGCWLVAFGLESGSEETLERIKKRATVADNLRAAEYTRKAGLQMLAFYLVGLPWENWSHLEATRDLMFEVNAEFVEVHLPVPYPGTELVQIATQARLMERDDIVGKDIYDTPTVGTKYLTAAQVQEFRRRTLLRYYLRPQYIARRVGHALVHNPRALGSYARYGLRLLRNNLRPATKAPAADSLRKAG